MTTDNPLIEMRGHIEQAIADLQAAIDPAALNAEKKAGLAVFQEAPHRYLPASAQLDALRTLEGEQAKRQGESLFRLTVLVDEDEAILAGTVRELRRAPSPLVAFGRQYGSHSPSDALAIGLLTEAVESRLTATLATTSPADMLATYEGALVSAEASAPVVIRWIERQCDGVWHGAKSSAQAQVSALTKLHKRITEVQAARVPAECRELQALYRKARSLAQLAVEGLKVKPQKPTDPAPKPRLVSTKGAA